MYEEIKESVFNEVIEDGGVPVIKLEMPQITSLDIVAWAYLKEEMVNTPESQEVKDLKEKYPNLIRFVTYMDTTFKDIETSVKPFENKLVWNHSPDNAQKIVGTL